MNEFIRIVAEEQRRTMTIQFRISVGLVLVLILLTSASTRARSLAAIDESLTRGRVTWNAAEPKQKQMESRNFGALDARTRMENRPQGLFGRIHHYVGTHKELLASDALFVVAASADTISSVHCAHVPRGNCFETNPLLPNYPSELGYWSFTSGVEAVYITAIHLWTHRHPDSPWRHFNWSVPVAASIYEIINVKDNYQIARSESPDRQLQEARARVSR
jgi:hypothetical protein